MSENTTTFEDKLKSIIELFDVTNALTEPLTESIENLLKTTAAEMNSEEASVLVRDNEEGDLKFLAAIGRVADQIKNLKIPVGKGIAGFVFSTGQPMVVAEAVQEESFYAEIDRQTGFSTQTILATPLKYNGEIIGVLEYINRLGDPPFEPFTPDEMDKAAFVAESVASLVNAYESIALLRDFRRTITIDSKRQNFEEMLSWVESFRSTAPYKDMLALAILVREISSRGDAEKQLCKELLTSLIRFSDTQNETSFLKI